MANRSRPHDPWLYDRARDLRRPLTPAESVLWRELRGRRFAGYKFRRQQPVGPYVADFYCPAARLVVELDGDTHVGQEAKDGRRQAWLEAAGYRVVRFWNTAVFDDLGPVLEATWTACQAAPASVTEDVLVSSPSPLEGEGGTGRRAACDG